MIKKTVEHIKKNRFEYFLGFAVAMFIALSFYISHCMVQEMRKVGLKNIVNDLWEGENDK